MTFPPIDVALTLPPFPPNWFAPFPADPVAVSVVAVRVPAPVSEMVPALRPAVFALAVPPDAVMVVRVVPPVEVAEMLPPVPLRPPVVVSAPELTVVPAEGDGTRDTASADAGGGAG